jgi:hypothetical protein
MVQGRFVTRILHGETVQVWQEIPPDACPAGHPGPTPKWGPCPDCGGMGRVWECRECLATVIDPDHQHG